MCLLGKTPSAPSVNEDFVLAARRVGCCQLSRVTASPYQRALLERGLDRRHRHLHPDRGMEQSMGYTASHWGRGPMETGVYMLGTF